MDQTPPTPAEPVYPDMPPDMTYQRALVWKSHKLDEVWIELQELKQKYAIRVAPDAPLELLTSPENLKIYEWVKRLPISDRSLNMLGYAIDHNKIDDSGEAKQRLGLELFAQLEFHLLSNFILTHKSKYGS